MDKMIDAFSEKAKRYLKSIDSRSVFPSSEDIERMKSLDTPLQDHSIEPLDVIKELDEFGAQATVASSGSRYFGFVIGGASPAPLAANLLAGVWDQNAGIEVTSPVSSFIETVCRKWLIDLLKLPSETEVGFVTGATMANFTGLAAARHGLLESAGWDVENDGLFNAPPIKVIVGEEVHVSVLKALSMLGLGRNTVIKVPVDAQGRMKAHLVPRFSEPTLICVQAGNVNTGAFDPIDEICDIASSSHAGYLILNDIVLNQVLVSFGDSETTKRVIQRLQDDGLCWCGGTEWQGKTAMRISVSSWKTTKKDVEDSADGIIRIADEENGKCG